MGFRQNIIIHMEEIHNKKLKLENLQLRRIIFRVGKGRHGTKEQSETRGVE